MFMSDTLVAGGNERKGKADDLDQEWAGVGDNAPNR